MSPRRHKRNIRINGADAQHSMSEVLCKKRDDYLEWPEYFMAVAFLSAQRSKDPNSQVGACIVNAENKIVGIGYNGMPNGCSDDLLPWRRTAENILDTKYPYGGETEASRGRGTRRWGQSLCGGGRGDMQEEVGLWGGSRNRHLPTSPEVVVFREWPGPGRLAGEGFEYKGKCMALWSGRPGPQSKAVLGQGAQKLKGQSSSASTRFRFEDSLGPEA
ncbi:hypothetical protein CB1_000998023 [Camelus ferus]|nr:hypothetical protein CB1_000998023 [Camelus ferus]